jgi:hypothetical protein
MLQSCDMILFQHTLSILSGLLAFLFYLSIARDALGGKAAPNPVSWFIWTLNDSLILSASFSAGGRNTLAVPFVYALFGWFVFFTALKNHRRPPTILESFCLTGALAGWVSYLASLGTLIALIVAVSVNTLGSFPTISGLISGKGKEQVRSWILIWLASLCSLASLEYYRFELFLFPVDSFIITSTVLSLIRFRNRPQ